MSFGYTEYIKIDMNKLRGEDRDMSITRYWYVSYMSLVHLWYICNASECILDGLMEWFSCKISIESSWYIDCISFFIWKMVEGVEIHLLACCDTSVIHFWYKCNIAINVKNVFLGKIYMNYMSQIQISSINISQLL